MTETNPKVKEELTEQQKKVIIKEPGKKSEKEPTKGEVVTAKVLIDRFEEETGKKAIWKGKITKTFEDWKKSQ